MRFHETGAVHGCEIQNGCKELNLGPLQEEQGPLTAKPSHQARFVILPNCTLGVHECQGTTVLTQSFLLSFYD